MSKNTTNDSPAVASARAGLLTKNELAAVLNCSERHVERLVQLRRIPIVRLSSRCVRFRLNAVLNALAKLEVEAVQ